MSDPHSTESQAATASPNQRKIALISLAVVLLLCLPLLLFGSTATRLAGAMLAIGSVSGFFYGAVRSFAFLLGLLFAAILAGPMGAALEGIVYVMAGTTGLMNRMLSIAVAGVIVLIITTILGEFAGRALFKRKPDWKRYNNIIGLAFGVIEGWILFTIIAWGALAIEPVAGANLDIPEEEHRGISRTAAQAVVSLAGSVRESAVGRTATAVNPMKETRMLRLVDDFAVVASDRSAMENFRNSPQIQELQERESVQRAMEMIQEDEELMEQLRTTDVSPRTVLSLLNNDTILRAIDDNNLMDELGPSIDAIAEALAEAKTSQPNNDAPR